MPVLAAFLGTLFTTIWGFVQAYLVARLVMRLAAVGGLYVAWNALKDITDTTLSQAWVAMPSVVAIPMTWIMPPNMPTIIALIITVESGLLAYRWAKILFNIHTTV